MKWIQQQRKVDFLAAEADANARHLADLRQQLACRVRNRLQQPESLAWAFAAGTLYGSASDQGPVRGVYSLYRHVNSATVFLALLASSQDSA